MLTASQAGPRSGVLAVILLTGCAPASRDAAILPQEAPWLVEARLDGPTRVSADSAEFRLTMTNGMDVPVCVSLPDDGRLPIIFYDVATGEFATPRDQGPAPPASGQGTPSYRLTSVVIEPGTSRTLAGPSSAVSDYVVPREGFTVVSIGSGVELEAEASLLTYPCTFASEDEARVAGEARGVVSNRSRRFTLG